MLSVSCVGQGFSSGSNGSYGPLEVTANATIDLPADGVLHCTTIRVAAGRILQLRRNANNTPAFLLATGDIRIEGSLLVKGGSGNSVMGGEGGPGGFNGGNPASVSTSPGAGYGPGAGKGGPATSSNPAGAVGPASYATLAGGTSTNKGATYGSALLLPLVGGSGGGGTEGTPGLGGGGGGGAVLLASNTRIEVTGAVDADGAGNSTGVLNGGSGGAIRLVAPVVAGNGTLRVVGANGGGAGRIRVDTLNRSGLALNFAPNGVTSVGSMMIVFPDPQPRLDIIEAAGTPIAEGSGPVFIQLPFGSSPERTLRLQARNFRDQVPVTVVLTPDQGTPTRYEVEIDNRTSNPAQVIVPVTLPLNVQVSVDAWTR
jgi:hypothetical protein